MEIPCSSISRASWSMNPPPRSTSSTTLAEDAKWSLRGKAVWRSERFLATSWKNISVVPVRSQQAFESGFSKSSVQVASIY
jgi:hypothetical protein